MSKEDYQHLIEESWKRELTPAEKQSLEGYLAAHALERREWEGEQRLTQALRGLSSVPVSSNFTARVMQAAQQATRKRTPWYQRWILPLRTAWIPRYAAAALVMSCISLVSIHQYQVHQSARLASDLVSVSEVANLPEMDSLKDFETIERLSRVEVSDSELLSALR